MTFDLEKARKIVDAMSPTPWIVLEDRYGQIDVIRNPNHPMHKEGVIELWGRTSETATPDAIGISYMRSEFPNALDEIERLRGEMENYGDDYVCQMKSKDARIQELEDAHKRSGAKYAKIINELRSSVYANTPGLKKQWDEILNTPANDKIGPSEEQIRAKMAELPSTPGPYRPAIREEAIRQLDVKPQVWQITEERKAAIKELSELLTAIGCPSCHYYIQKNYGEDITVLRAMLTEADHDKP